MAVGLRVDLLADTSQLGRGLRNAEGQFDSFGRRVTGSMGKAFKLAGAAMIAGIGAGVAGLTALTGQVQQAQKIIIAGTGATGEALRQMTGDTVAVMRTVPEGMVEIASALQEVRTVFQASGSDLHSLTKLGLDFARVTGADAGGAINSLSDFLKVFGLSASAADDAFGDVLKTAQRYGVDGAALTQQLGDQALSMKVAGFSAEQTVAIFGQLAATGKRVGEITPALKRVGSEALKLGKDPRQHLADIVTILQSAAPGTEKFNEAMKSLGEEGGPALATALRDIEGFDPFATIGDSTGYIATQAAAALTFGDHWRQIVNVISAEFVPVALRLSDWMRDTLVPLVRDDLLPSIISTAVQVRDKLTPAFETASGWVAGELVPKVQMFGREVQALAGWLRNWVLADIISVGTWIGQSILPKTQEWARVLGSLAVDRVQQLAGWVGSMYEAFSSRDWKGAFDEFAAGPSGGEDQLTDRLAQFALLGIGLRGTSKALTRVAGAFVKTGRAIVAPITAARVGLMRFSAAAGAVTATVLAPLRAGLFGAGSAMHRLAGIAQRLKLDKLVGPLVRAGGAADTVGIALGKAGPAVAKLAGRFSVLGSVVFAGVDLWKTWSDSTKSFIDKVSDSLIAVGIVLAPVVLAFGAVPIAIAAAVAVGVGLVIKFRSEIIGAFQKVIDFIGSAAAKIWEFRWLAGPFAWIAEGVVKLTDKLGLVDKAAAATKAVFDSTLRPAVQAVIDVVDWLAVKTLPVAGKAFEMIAEAAKAGWDLVVDTTLSAVNGAINIINGFIDAINLIPRALGALGIGGGGLIPKLPNITINVDADLVPTGAGAAGGAAAVGAGGRQLTSSQQAAQQGRADAAAARRAGPAGFGLGGAVGRSPADTPGGFALTEEQEQRLGTAFSALGVVNPLASSGGGAAGFFGGSGIRAVGRSASQQRADFARAIAGSQIRESARVSTATRASAADAQSVTQARTAVAEVETAFETERAALADQVYADLDSISNIPGVDVGTAQRIFDSFNNQPEGTTTPPGVTEAASQALTFALHGGGPPNTQIFLPEGSDPYAVFVANERSNRLGLVNRQGN